VKLQRMDLFRPVYPTPAAMITCVSPTGRPNIITLGEVYMLALEPLIVGIGIRPRRFSYGLIAETREFVVNFPTAEPADLVDYCGMVSGTEVDKFAATGLTPAPASVVRPPLIEECPVNLECRVREVLPMGSHHVFVGDVVAGHVEDWALDERGHLDPVRARAIAFIGRSYWAFDRPVERALVRNRKVSPLPRAKG
jgi:flavin reductase (DIM6/NTAB) family NADH-FMN oxidoreductase RutF